VELCDCNIGKKGMENVEKFDWWVFIYLNW